MKLILKQSIENLGRAGQVVSVKPGYARNYLLPQGLAYEASDANLKKLEAEQKVIEERMRRDHLEARRRSSQLDGIALTFTARASEEGHLFGSVSAADILEKLNGGRLDFEVERKHLILEEPIKSLGTHRVPVRLVADVQVEVEIRVEREDG